MALEATRERSSGPDVVARSERGEPVDPPGSPEPGLHRPVRKIAYPKAARAKAVKSVPEKRSSTSASEPAKTIDDPIGVETTNASLSTSRARKRKLGMFLRAIGGRKVQWADLWGVHRRRGDRKSRRIQEKALPIFAIDQNNCFFVL